MIRILKFIFWILIGILIGIHISYRFNHPEKTETQLFFDMINGKIFKEYGKISKI